MKHYWWIILIAVAVGIGSAAFFAQRSKPIYHASASLVVKPSGALETSREVVESINALDRRSVVATLARMPSSRAVRREAQQTIGLSPEEMASNTVSTIVVPDTNILEISVEGHDRSQVTQVANAVARQTIVYSRQFYPVYELRALDSAPTLGKRAGPDVVRQLVAGGLLGLLIGLAAAFLLSQFRRPEPEEYELLDND